MNKVKILWSGITGRVGTEAQAVATNNDFVEIVAGVCRRNFKYYTYDELDSIIEDFDIIIDFSHKESFDTILEYAIKKKKPLIIGTTKLSEEQDENIEKASHIIPIFRGGNFRFEVKKFIDDVVEYAWVHNDIELIETHYKTKTLPSETSKVIAKKVFDATGKTIKINSFLEYDDLINDYKVGHLHCRVHGFTKLVEDIFKIAVMMKDKTPNGVYDLDRLIEEEETII